MGALLGRRVVLDLFIGEAEVVVGREVDDLLAVDHAHRFLLTVHHAQAAEEVLQVRDRPPIIKKDFQRTPVCNPSQY